MQDEDHAVTLKVVPLPGSRRDLAGNNDRLVANCDLIIKTRVNKERARSGEEDSMSDTVSGEDGANPSQGVTGRHGLWHILKNEDNNDEKTTSNEVHEQSQNLSIDVRLEAEGPDVGVGDNRRWIEQEEKPDSVVGLVEQEGEEDDEEDRNVSHCDIKDNVGAPVSCQTHA